MVNEAYCGYKRLMKKNNYLNSPACRAEIEKMRTILAQDQQMLNYDRGQIKCLQEQRLREILTFAKNNSSWHKQRLADFDVDNFRLDDLAKLPTMDKADLMAHWNEIVTDPNLNYIAASKFLMAQTDFSLFRGFHLFASGGSSGRRGLFVWAPDELAMMMAHSFRYQYRDGLTSSQERMMVAAIAAIKPVHLSQPIYAAPVLAEMQSVALSALAPIEQLVESLNYYQPTHLNGYPSVLARLALQALQGNLNIKPVRILVGSEPLLPNMLEVIHRAWSTVLVTNVWGSTDAGIHAASCDYSQGNLHLNEDSVIIEAVDHDNRPVVAGERATKILITNLLRKSMPVFRYEMDDAVMPLNENCACGSHFKLVRAIEGRYEEDFFYANNIIVIPEVFENVIMQEAGIDEYQVFQTADGAEISIVPEKNATVNIDIMQSNLLLQLTELGLNNPIVTINCVEKLKRHLDTGKLKRFHAFKHVGQPLILS